MKKFFTVAAVSIASLVCNAQSTSPKSEVITDSTQTKKALFSKANLWVANTWKSAKDVIQMKDEESGTIVVKGLLSTKVKVSMGVKLDGHTESTITIKCKDGKVKIEFNDTRFVDTYRSWVTESEPKNEVKYWTKWVADVTVEQDALIASFKSALTKNDDF